MTYAQCIEARRLLGMTQKELAKATKLSQTLIGTFESTGHMARAQSGRDRFAILRAFFEKAGIEFVEENGAEHGCGCGSPKDDLRAMY